MTTEKAINTLLERIRTDIVREQRAKRMRASGQSAESMDIFAGPLRGRLVGADYFRQQVHGRGPGSFPPVDQIREWIDRKGIQPRDITKDSLAFLIARKIARRGTDVFLRRRAGLDLASIFEKRTEEFTEQMVDIKKVEYMSKITEAFKRSVEALQEA